MYKMKGKSLDRDRRGNHGIQISSAHDYKSANTAATTNAAIVEPPAACAEVAAPVNTGNPDDIVTVLLAGGDTGLTVVEATGDEKISKVVGTGGAGSESVNSPEGCS
jgi:hypothetical protein